MVRVRVRLRVRLGLGLVVTSVTWRVVPPTPLAPPVRFHTWSGLGARARPGLGQGQGYAHAHASTLAHLRHVLHEPAQLGRAEVRGDGQAGHAAHGVLPTQLGPQRLHHLARPAVVPEYRLLGSGLGFLLEAAHVVQRRARSLVPDDGRLALVGDTDADQVAGGGAGLLQRARSARLDRREDGHRVHLRPSGLRRDRLERELMRRDRLEVEVVEDHPAAARALVDRGEQPARRVDVRPPCLGRERAGGGPPRESA
eukprot:scaffold4862_cov61-Phaeocystis_antarctica.AAC.1